MSDKHSAIEPSTLDGPADPLIGQLIDGRYRILNLLAVGGMGRVYRAEQTSLSRIVALKVLAIPREMATVDPHFKERFALEAATASRLANPNTVTIFDYGRTAEDLYYLVMEFVEGITLGRLLKTEKRLVPERALHIARQVCHSLVEAHARGIIHRDIKPANILLLEPDLSWVKVLDFGIARFTDDTTEDPEQHMTRVGTYVGTPEYMAPESFYSRVDHRGDIYSIGVLLYLMLSGRVPLQGPTNTATILMSVHDPVPQLEAALGIPPSIESLVRRCLAKKPEDRPQTMVEVLNELNAELIAMGGMVSSPMHPALTGTGVRPSLELTVPPTPMEPTVVGRIRPWILVASAVLVVGTVAGLLIWHRLAPTEPLESPALQPLAPKAAPRVEPPLLEPGVPAQSGPAVGAIPVQEGMSGTLDAPSGPTGTAPQGQPGGTDVPAGNRPAPADALATVPRASATTGTPGALSGTIPGSAPAGLGGSRAGGPPEGGAASASAPGQGAAQTSSSGAKAGASLDPRAGSPSEKPAAASSPRAASTEPAAEAPPGSAGAPSKPGGSEKDRSQARDKDLEGYKPSPY